MTVKIEPAPMGLARCPDCGCEFKPWLVMQLRDIAVMFGVKVSTVRSWTVRAGLNYRLWRLSAFRVRRVVYSTDLARWTEAKLPKPGDDSTTARLWAKDQARGPHANRVRHQRALANAQRSIPTD